MKLKYLGTAAAEGWPAIFCHCDACMRARKAGGRNIRSRSQALIDDKLLVDFPPDSFYHSIIHNVDLVSIGSCIVTHSHEDHLYPMDFLNRREYFAYLDDTTPQQITVYGKDAVCNDMKMVAKHIGTSRVVTKEIEPFVTLKIEGLDVTPLLADHDPTSGCVIYIVSDGKSTMLYANDTGYFPDATWEYLASSDIRFDYVSLDCTGGLGAQYEHGHMGTNACCKVRDELLRLGRADDKTIFCLQHFSHNGKAIYDEIVGPAKEMGFLVSYDGMEIEF